ncbi:fimbria/pilus outer membrane usher protein [Escherichia coli]
MADVNNYYRNQAYIDLNNLPENAEATQSVVQATLTEGAIGYRKFGRISSGKKRWRSCVCKMAAIRRLARK